MEYDDKNKFVNNDEISKANQKTFNTAKYYKRIFS